jgi:hypothetical protein
VELDLYCCYISDDNWSSLCQSLQAHPTLTNLDLRITRPRTCLLAEVMRHNTILHTIALPEDERDEQIYTESILPYLETNRYRPRILTIKKTDIQIRRPLLGRALQTESVRHDSNLLWMFLSGNADVVIQSIE